jgi:crotonobetainyl-CoA:carnitine CoA-transferase CaiB-like acyl-CoA transferase
VNKVEIPEGGNMMRKLPPVLEGQSFFYLIQGRNKKSITVDIHTEKGQEAIRWLVKESDVALENYRPGTLEKWQLGYDKLRKINLKLILLRASCFDQSGLYRDWPSGEAVISAMARLTFATSFSDQPPARTGYSLPNIYCRNLRCHVDPVRPARAGSVRRGAVHRPVPLRAPLPTIR